jgi:hypothetical protein
MTVDPLAADAFGALAEEYERGRAGWPADAVAGLLERHGVDEVTLHYKAMITTARRVDG